MLDVPWQMLFQQLTTALAQLTQAVGQGAMNLGIPTPSGLGLGPPAPGLFATVPPRQGPSLLPQHGYWP